MDLEIGDVVQLNEKNEQFSYCMLVVTEPKSWGCQGYICAHIEGIPATRFKRQAYCRPTWDRMEYVGKIVFMPKEDIEEGDDE